MIASRGLLLAGALWSVGAHGGILAVRFVASIALARLLSPELLGVMVIVNGVRNGIELFSDIGIRQNVVQNPNGGTPEFYNAAWTLQVMRGCVLAIAGLLATVPLVWLYDVPILAIIFPVASANFVLLGLTSIGLPLAARRLQFKRLNAFDASVDVVTTLVQLIFVYLSPTIWALVFGGIFGTSLRAFASYFLLPGPAPQLFFDKKSARDILIFGKWIFISSAIYFLSLNFDRLYLGAVVPIAVLGVYGIARALSDMIVVLVLRIADLIIFPVISSSSAVPRMELRDKLAKMRMALLFAAALGISVLFSSADLIVSVLYDERYRDAGWMLSLLSLGTWFTILASVNDATLLGLGRPTYSAVANACKLTWLVITLPIGYAAYGIAGAVVAVSLGDACRYAPLLLGQIRERFTFGSQDFLATMTLIALIAFWEVVHRGLGLGLTWLTLPHTT